jgi:hypothetical protein
VRVVGGRVESDRFLECRESLAGFALQEQQVALGDPGLGHARLELQRTPARRQRLLDARGIHAEAPDPGVGQRVGQTRMRLRELRVGRDRALEQRGGLRQRGVAALAQQRLASQVEIVGFGIARAAALEQAGLLRRERESQRAHQLLRDLALRGEHVLEAAVEALRP